MTSFIVFLFPYSIDALSVNYSFLFFPLIYGLYHGAFKKPKDVYLAIIACYVFIFVIAMLYQYESLDYLGRRMLSFVLFMSMFSFMFLKIDDRMFKAFKIAIIIVSLIFSSISIITFIASGGVNLGYEAKDIVGSQRYGFIYILAFWVLLLSTPLSGVPRFVTWAAVAIIVVGLFLTFSRSSVFALFLSLAAYFLFSIKDVLKILQRMMLSSFFVFALCFSVLYWVLQAYFPVVSIYFEDRLFSFILDSDRLGEHLSSSDTSEGVRLFIWSNVLEYVIYNPLTGSGYLGVWTLPIDVGSAHNQLVDVLFRTGCIGFFIYIYLLYRLALTLRARHPGLFWGLIGVVIYGFFHETFKESQGAFVLAFLLGWMTQAPSFRKGSHLPVRNPALKFSSALPPIKKIAQQ